MRNIGPSSNPKFLRNLPKIVWKISHLKTLKKRIYDLLKKNVLYNVMAPVLKYLKKHGPCVDSGLVLLLCLL